MSEMLKVHLQQVTAAQQASRPLKDRIIDVVDDIIDKYAEIMTHEMDEDRIECMSSYWLGEKQALDDVIMDLHGRHLWEISPKARKVWRISPDHAPHYPDGDE